MAHDTLLAARLRAGVKVDNMIMLDNDDRASGLVDGDVGVVREITPDGVVVDWDRGFSLRIDPATVSFHELG